MHKSGKISLDFDSAVCVVRDFYVAHVDVLPKMMCRRGGRTGGARWALAPPEVQAGGYTTQKYIHNGRAKDYLYKLPSCHINASCLKCKNLHCDGS